MNNRAGRRAFLSLLAVLPIAVAVTMGAMGQSVPSKLISYPEMILHNGKILTADDKFSIVEAVAIRNGELLAVGTNQTVLALKGPSTQMLDLQGKTVVPGFMRMVSQD